MVFSQGGGPRAREAVARIDSAIHDLGIQPHHGKDVSEATDCTLISVDLVDGQRLTPHKGKMALIYVSMVFLLSHLSVGISPLELQAVLSHLAWFALLSRPTCLCLHFHYEDARDDNTTTAPLRAESAS